MRQIIAYERGVKIATFPNDCDVRAAYEKWAALHSATVEKVDNSCYGFAAVTVALPDGTGRRIEFVLAVG